MRKGTPSLSDTARQFQIPNQPNPLTVFGLWEEREGEHAVCTDCMKETIEVKRVCLRSTEKSRISSSRNHKA